MDKVRQTVGELNGANAFWFKITIRIVPIMFGLMLTWGVWVTASLFELKAFQSVGARFTPAHGASMEERVIKHHDEDMDRHVTHYHR